MNYVVKYITEIFCELPPPYLYSISIAIFHTKLITEKPTNSPDTPDSKIQGIF
jgi:hypothetical protein